MAELIELIRPDPEQDEDFNLAHQHIIRYVDGLVDEYKIRKENAFLIEGLDKVVAELKEIKGELSEIKQQTEVVTESVQYLNVTRRSFGRVDTGKQKAYDPEARLEGLIRRFMEENGAELEQVSSGRAASGLPKFQADEYYSVFGSNEPEEPEATPPSPSPAVRQVKVRPVQKQEPPPIQYEDLSAPVVPAPVVPAPVATAAPDIPAVPVPDVPAPPTAPPMDMAQVMAMMETKKKPSAITIASNVLFYLCMALLIIGAVTFAQSKDVNKSLFGFRYYYIKSPSMVPVYPVGSVVFTKVTDPEKIKVGDDITVFIGDDKNEAYLTHRVVEITTDPSTNELAYRTKGVNNKSNDPTPYNAKLLAGRVVFCIPVLGTIMTFVQTQLIFVIGIFVLLLALSFMLRLLFAKEEPAQSGANAQIPAPAKLNKKQLAAAEKQRQEDMLRKLQEDYAAKMNQ